ncbi:MAG: hypothetical protein KC591_17335 [Gemmatimonadetes bacterium]|nr:hypothetical protein [Gemmatimonadota bacterium]
MAKCSLACSIALLSLAVLAPRAGATIIDLDSQTLVPVSVMLGPGMYFIEPVGPDQGGAYTAWNAWGTVSCANPDGCLRTCPTSVRGWLNTYVIESPQITGAWANGMRIDPIPARPPCDLETALVDMGGVWNFMVNDSHVYPTPEDALAHRWTSIILLHAAGPVYFTVGDVDTIGNEGGISLRITSVVSVDETSFAEIKSLYR